MTDTNIDTLNDVTKTLIDSCKGYEMACEQVEKRADLVTAFQSRKSERQQLVNEFQAQVRTLGGEPETDGGVSGAVHRGFTKFASIFQDDASAALSAIDDGEEHLVEMIEGELENEGLSPETRQLLVKAHASAKAGERFADAMDD